MRRETRKGSPTVHRGAVRTPRNARQHSDNCGEWSSVKVISCSQAARESGSRRMKGKEKAYSEGLLWFIRPWPYAHTVCPGKKDWSEGPLLVLPPGWAALMWRYQDEQNHDGEFLTRKTKKEKKRKCRNRKENSNSPRA